MGIFPGPFNLKLCTLKPDFGLVTSTTALVIRVFAVQYMETLNENQRIFRPEPAERLAQREYESKRQRLLEQLSDKFSFERPNSQPSENVDARHLGDSGQEVFHALQRAQNRETLMASLNDRQMRNLEAHRQQLMMKALAENLPPRNVTRVLKARI
ncbi:Breast cancer 2, early onset, partial [Cichlidogyrus casuarinus]